MDEQEMGRSPLAQAWAAYTFSQGETAFRDARAELDRRIREAMLVRTSDLGAPETPAERTYREARQEEELFRRGKTP